MGVVEFFSVITNNKTVSSAIKQNVSQSLQSKVDEHIFIDFNSIIHNVGVVVANKINAGLKIIIAACDKPGGFSKVDSLVLDELKKKYIINENKKKIFDDLISRKYTIDDAIKTYHEIFDEKAMDDNVIFYVINDLIMLLKTYCTKDKLKTVMIAIDGVVSKAKMMEQRQRRYTSALQSLVNKKIFDKYTNYLKRLPGHVYDSIKHEIKWSRNKITPGTPFMDRLCDLLASENAVIDKIKNYFSPSIKVIVSGYNEVGEGEKKIMNYIEKHHSGSKDNIIVYSPDGDVIFLCMILSTINCWILRFNQQGSCYDFIDIRVLKENIGMYINNHPDFKNTKYDVTRISYDIICLGSLFGNDFVHRVECMSAKQGFTILMEAYSKSIRAMNGAPSQYLVKVCENDKPRYRLNLSFLRHIIGLIVEEENDFIELNHLYNRYIKFGQLKYVFSASKLRTDDEIRNTYHEFHNNYEELQNRIKSKRNYNDLMTDTFFMLSLKKCIMMYGEDNNSCVYMSDDDFVKAIIKHYDDTKSFPRISINIHMFNNSISNKRFSMDIKNKNEYELELFRFDKMLNEYNIKLNAQKLDLSKNSIEKFYLKYFEDKVVDNGVITAKGNEVMEHYLEGLMWVFNYYFNDNTYLNKWYYKYEKSPLLRDFLKYLNSLNRNKFREMRDAIDIYKVSDVNNFFNPLQQLAYVSPNTNDQLLSLLPESYGKVISTLHEYYVNVEPIAQMIVEKEICNEVDCKSAPYFSKCLIDGLHKPDDNFDKHFIKLFKNVRLNDEEKKRSVSKIPNF